MLRDIAAGRVCLRCGGERGEGGGCKVWGIYYARHLFQKPVHSKNGIVIFANGDC